MKTSHLHHSGPLLENGLDRSEHRYGRYGFASFSGLLEKRSFQNCPFSRDSREFGASTVEPKKNTNEKYSPVE